MMLLKQHHQYGGAEANCGDGDSKSGWSNDLDGGGDSDDVGDVDDDDIDSNIANDASCGVFSDFSEDTASVDGNSNVDGGPVFILMMMVSMMMIMIVITSNGAGEHENDDNNDECRDSVKEVFKNKQIDLANFSVPVFTRWRESLKYNFLFNIILFLSQSSSCSTKYNWGKFCIPLLVFCLSHRL